MFGSGAREVKPPETGPLLPPLSGSPDSNRPYLEFLLYGERHFV